MKIQEKRGDFEYENWYFKFKSLNLGVCCILLDFYYGSGVKSHWHSPHMYYFCKNVKMLKMTFHMYAYHRVALSMHMHTFSSLFSIC